MNFAMQHIPQDRVSSCCAFVQIMLVDDLLNVNSLTTFHTGHRAIRVYNSVLAKKWRCFADEKA